MRNMLAAILIALPVSAMSASLEVDHAWSRAAMAGHEGVVYLTITNSGEPDQLTTVTTPVAAMASLHQTIDDNGVMKMRAVTSLSVDHNQSVTLKPGSYHIMLMNLKQPLKQGDNFPITLTFAKAGQVTATAVVGSAGAGSMPQPMNMPMPANPKQP